MFSNVFPSFGFYKAHTNNYFYKCYFLEQSQHFVTIQISDTTGCGILCVPFPGLASRTVQFPPGRSYIFFLALCQETREQKWKEEENCRVGVKPLDSWLARLKYQLPRVLHSRCQDWDNAQNRVWELPDLCRVLFCAVSALCLCSRQPTVLKFSLAPRGWVLAMTQGYCEG